MTTSQEEWRRPAAALGRLVRTRGFSRVAGCPSCCRKSFHLAGWQRTVSSQGWLNPRSAREKIGSRHVAETKPRGSKRHRVPATAPSSVSVRRKRLKAHFARQIWAKSNQVLSAAAPVSFIFCHSSPHACIRARDAGGKFRGSGGGVSLRRWRVNWRGGNRRSRRNVNCWAPSRRTRWTCRGQRRRER